MGKNQNNNYMFKGFFRPYLEKIKRNILHTFKIDIESFEKWYAPRQEDNKK